MTKIVLISWLKLFWNHDWDSLEIITHFDDIWSYSRTWWNDSFQTTIMNHKIANCKYKKSLVLHIRVKIINEWDACMKRKRGIHFWFVKFEEKVNFINWNHQWMFELQQHKKSDFRCMHVCMHECMQVWTNICMNAWMYIDGMKLRFINTSNIHLMNKVIE